MFKFTESNKLWNGIKNIHEMPKYSDDNCSPKDIKLHKKNRPKKVGQEEGWTSGGYHRAHCCYLMAIIAGADVMSGPVITMCWAHSLTAGHIASASKLLQLMPYCSCCYCL